MADKNQKTTKYYYRVRFGYNPMEFVSIEAGGDLERALYAMIEQVPVTLNGRLIHGKTILRIEPDFHKYTGWAASYVPRDGHDEAQMLRDAPKEEEFERVLSEHRVHVSHLLESGNVQQIGQGNALPAPTKQLENG